MRYDLRMDIPKQENPIYCYRLLEDKDTIKLVKFIIDKYLYKKRDGYIGKYMFDTKLIGAASTSYREFYDDNLDKVVNKQMYTFKNLSNTEVIGIFDEYLEAEELKALNKYAKCKERYKLFKKFSEEDSVIHESNN